MPANSRCRTVPVSSLFVPWAAALLVVLTSTASGAAAPWPGTLDSGFGNGGKVLTAISGVDYGNDVALQADGKIVVAGNGRGDFALARYESNGSLDPTFGTGGKVTTDFGRCCDGVANAVAVQPDQKIVAAGKANGGGGVTSPGGDWVLARYLANGELDPSFGSSGKVVMNFRPDRGSVSLGIAGVAIQVDGKIVAVGTIFLDFGMLGGDADFALAPPGRRHAGPHLRNRRQGDHRLPPRRN